MNEIGTFDILGPNMIGPSSSHTAGALRIAFIAGKMVEKPAAVRFVLYGSFARTYHGHGTDRALVGGILGYHPDDERIRDSFEHAKEAGLDFTFEENFTDKEIYPNTVDIYVKDENGNEMSLRGKSIGGGNAVITRLNGVDVDLTGNYSTIVVQHIDKKGYAGVRDGRFERLRLKYRFPAPLPREQGQDGLRDHRGGYYGLQPGD